MTQEEIDRLKATRDELLDICREVLASRERYGLGDSVLTQRIRDAIVKAVLWAE